MNKSLLITIVFIATHLFGEESTVHPTVDYTSPILSQLDHIYYEWSQTATVGDVAINDHFKIWISESRRRLEFERNEKGVLTQRWVSILTSDGSRKLDVLSKELDISSKRTLGLQWVPPPLIGYAAFLPPFSYVRPYEIGDDPFYNGGLLIDLKSVEHSADGSLCVHTHDVIPISKSSSQPNSKNTNSQKRDISFSLNFGPKWKASLMAETDSGMKLIQSLEIKSMETVNAGKLGLIDIPASGDFIEYEIDNGSISTDWKWQMIDWKVMPVMEDELFELPTHLADIIRINGNLPKK